MNVSKRSKLLETRQAEGRLRDSASSLPFWTTLSMFYKGQSIRDGRQNLKKSKGW